ETPKPSSRACATCVTTVFFPTLFEVVETRTERPGFSSCSTSVDPVLTITSTVPPGSAAAHTWYSLPPVAALGTTAPKCCPWLRERATRTAPPWVQTAHRRS